MIAEEATVVAAAEEAIVAAEAEEAIEDKDKSLVYIKHIGLCLYRKRNIWAKPIK